MAESRDRLLRQGDAASLFVRRSTSIRILADQPEVYTPFRWGTVPLTGVTTTTPSRIRRTPSSNRIRRTPTRSSRKAMRDITSQQNSKLDFVTPEKKLLNSIDIVMKVVMEELNSTAKREERARKVRTLMSMR